MKKKLTAFLAVILLYPGVSGFARHSKGCHFCEAWYCKDGKCGSR